MGFVAISAVLVLNLFCCEIGFATIYALLCGEKVSPKVRLWRKIDKYEVCLCLKHISYKANILVKFISQTYLLWSQHICDIYIHVWLNHPTLLGDSKYEKILVNRTMMGQLFPIKCQLPPSAGQQNLLHIGIISVKRFLRLFLGFNSWIRRSLFAVNVQG